MPEPREHMSNRGALESLLRRIPGFRGYLEKEYRRDSEQLLRQWLAARLDRSKRDLDSLGRALLSQGRSALLPQLDRVRARLDKTIGRIQGAMAGYSGVFDLVHVDEALLDRVYQYSLKMADDTEHFAAAVGALAGSTPKDDAFIADLLGRLDTLERHWDGREDILRGVQ